MGAAKGFEHDSIPDSMATIWEMGHETGLWQAYIRTDYELLTKGKVGPNGKNLTQFDAVVFANSTGEMPLDDQRKKTCSLSFMTTARDLLACMRLWMPITTGRNTPK